MAEANSTPDPVDLIFDPHWILSKQQKDIQAKLIKLCCSTLRPNAVISDDTYEFPRKNLNALASLNLLGLCTPKELGGLGESHQFAVMVVETIARYGCSSTAMVYVMHIGAVATLCFGHHDNPVATDLLRRMDKDKLVGSLSYSDAATGGHFWYPLASKAMFTKEKEIQMLKYASWTTSAGCADWYVCQTTSPNFNGDYSNLVCFIVMKDETRANTSDWQALGMRGNQSGPLICEGVLKSERVLGKIGQGAVVNDEVIDPWFLCLSSACWNGLALAAIDIAKAHVVGKHHADIGIRVCDYPTIQDYFGEAVSGTNSARLMNYEVARAMDIATNKNDWSIHKDPKCMPRFQYLAWNWALKFHSAANVTKVVDKMLHACGGTGYKKQLGLERILRDAKASWVMGPSNEVVRQWVGKAFLLGMESTDFWFQQIDKRRLHAEIQKMTNAEKTELADRLMQEVSLNQEAEATPNAHGYDFYNPFNTAKPQNRENASIKPDAYTKLKLVKRTPLSMDSTEQYTFKLSDAGGTGCIAGQYVKVAVPHKEKNAIERFFSPVSTPHSSILDLVIKFETQGEMSDYFSKMNLGDSVSVKGPCGGFEYKENKVDSLVLLAGGIGVTPAVQIVRTVSASSTDKTNILLIYYADTKADILYKEELDKLSVKDGRIKVVYTVGEADEGWTGFVGYIDPPLMEKEFPIVAKQKVVMCGGPSMVIGCLTHLFTKSYPSENIYIYGAFGTEQVRKVYGRHAKLSNHTLCNS